MEAKEFVTKLKERVIDNDFKIYEELIESKSRIKDPTWQGIIEIYNSINKKEQLALLNFLRLVQVNTLSHVLGILDGTVNLSNRNLNFILKTSRNDNAINGDLQDIFLEMEETQNL